MTDHNPISRLPVDASFRSGRSSAADKALQVVFVRQELDLILNIYGRYVVMGEWRDYAIAHETDCAVFSIFRRTSERPLYRIKKTPALANRQGQWTLLGMDGRVLKRGHDLPMLLRVFDRQMLSSVD